MLILKNKKGYIMLEVICSIIIFLNVILYITSVHIRSVKLKTYNDNVEDYISSVNILKNIILYNYNKESLSNIFEKEAYINEKYITPNVLKNANLKNIISSDKPNNKPYIRLTKNKEKLTISLQAKEKNIDCEFYKGD